MRPLSDLCWIEMTFVIVLASVLCYFNVKSQLDLDIFDQLRV